MIGITIKRQSMHGGLNDFPFALSYMMWYALTISAVSMSIILSHMEIRMQYADSGFMGTKVLEFAFDTRDTGSARDYLCDYYTPADKINIPLIGVIMRSNAKICIVPIQDYLGLDNKSRMNTPSSVGCNWRWRVDGKELNEILAKEIKEITVRYGRSN